MYNKCAAKLTRNESIPNLKKKIFANLGLLKHYFLLQIKRRARSVQAEL